ncbi:MAG: S8 family serine peptidase [Synergistaceae bacterium]|nr:S8 family serine peptidase [Synergistaceae bacterium]
MRRALNTLLIVFCAVFFAASLSYASVEPNDTFYSRQWGLKAIHAPAVWEITTGSSNIYAVVMDTGIEAGHEDIRGNFDAEHSRNFSMKMGETFANIDDIDSQDYVDTNGHGTHVAGIIAARGDNGKGIAGMSWHTKIITVKVSDTNGVVNVYRRGEIISSALEYVKDILSANPEMKIVVNMSLGWWENVSPAKASSNEYRMWQAFHDLDMTDRALICIAAGNDGENISAPTNGKYYYPVSYSGIKNMITVANAQEDDKYSRLPGEIGGGRASNWSRTSVDIAAPGTRIFSTLSRQYSDTTKEVTSHDGNNYTNKDGTSQAAPFVAGTAALLWSEYPGMTAGEVKRAIINGANSYYASDYTKYGFLDAKGAFDVMAGIDVQPGVPVDDIRFPDEAFRNYILENIDRNGDSRLNADEISGITSIDISGLTVSDLEGIQYFSALEELDCSGTNIESLPGRESLPNVTAINAANCAGLGAVLFDGLDQDGAKLVSLNVSGCTSLTKIECGSNDLEALDVSGCTALEELWCDYNKLTYLDVSGCPKLTELHCEHNRLTALDMHQDFTGTAEFDGQKRPLAMLHESSDGKTFSVDISGLIPAGKRNSVVNVTASILKSADNDAQPTGISPHDGYNISYDSSRAIITITGKTPGSIPKPTRIRYVYKTGSVCAMGVIVYIVSSGGDNPEIPPYVPVNGDAVLDETIFPDPKFLAYVKQFDADNDGKLSVEEIKRVIRIGGVRFWNDKTRSYTGGALNSSIESLKGIEYFTSMIELECRNISPQQIDVRNCQSLKKIHSGSSQLIANALPLLEEVTCVGVGEMDFSECRSLKTLNVTGNTLRKIDIHGCISLDKFIYTVNQSLEEINAVGCISLKELSCYGSSYYNNHGSLHSIDITGCTALEKLDVDSNILTELDISENVSLKTLDISGNYLSAIDLSGCPKLETLVCYENRLTEIDLGKCSSLAHLSCGENMLKSLDLSKNTALRTLACNSNDITALSLKSCHALEGLNVSHNRMQSLDLSGCPELASLNENHIAGCPIVMLDISGCAKVTDLRIHIPGILRVLKADGCTSLASLTCSGNSLDILSVKDCNALVSLDCASNSLIAIDVETCTALRYLNCHNNRLERLDTRGMTSLQRLYCGNNRLRELNVLGCTNLKDIACQNNNLTELELSGHDNLHILQCSNNNLATLNLHGKVSYPNGLDLYGQTISGMTLSENGGHETPYHFDFRNLMSAENIANISSAQGRKGYDKVRTMLEGGIAYFETMPTSVEYRYDTLKKYVGGDEDSKYLMRATAEFSGLDKISVEAPKITLATLPDAIVGEVYDETIAFTGTAPVKWTVTEYDREILSLTAGYASRPFSETGRLYGRPGRTGTYRFTVTVSNDAGNDTKTFTLNVITSGGGNTNNNTDTNNSTDNPGNNNAPSDELAGRLRNILNADSNTPVQNLTRNNASIYRERNNTGEYHANGSRIAAVLPEIQVSQEGIYIIPVSFDSPIPAGSYLAWHFFSDDVAQAQNDGESCVFLDADSNELAMPLTREISGVNAAAYLEADTLYAPYVSYSSAGSNNPGTSSGGSGGGCESFGFMGMILAAAMLFRRKHV